MILVTGATGFIGSAVVRQLARDGRLVRAAVRRDNGDWRSTAGVQTVEVGDMSPNSDWARALVGVSAVIHAAARVHVMKETADSPLKAFRQVNVEGTANLARQAAKAGVKRFIFLSSIKVNGESTELGHAFAADDVPAPVDPYGISKLEAEDELRKIAAETGMEVVIIRPPLVYGPGVKANFRAVMKWLCRGVPLPLGAIHNRRSMVALANLVDLTIVCLAHPAAANQTFLVSDGEDLSTTGLLQRMANALGRKARLIPIPGKALALLAGMLGQKAVAQRLCGSLQVDISKTRQVLGWHPPLSVDEGLKVTAEGFLREAGV